MSWLKLRLFLFALVFGVASLTPVTNAAAAPASSASPRSALEAAAMQNEMGPPVMAAASRFEATAPVRPFKAPASSATIVSGVTNPRVFREVFGFAYASSIGSTGTTEPSQTLFTSFVRGLRAALPAGSYLTVDTYSGSAGYRSGTTYYGFFDISSLASYVDAFFVMAYDMEYSNAYAWPLNCSSFCIGPTAPLTTYLYNDSRASSEYRAVVAGSKVIMGIPYYGRKVCVAGGYTPSSAPPNAVAKGGASADGYLDASTEQGYYANRDYHI